MCLASISRLRNVFPALPVMICGLTVSGGGNASMRGAQSTSDIESTYKQETSQYEKAFDAFENSERRDQAFHYDLSPLAHDLVAKMRSATSLLDRQTAAVYLSMLRDYEVILPTATYEEVLRIAPPNSPVWAKLPDAIGQESDALPPQTARQFLKSLELKNSDRGVRARANLALVALAAHQHDIAQYTEEYRQLSSSYGDIKDLAFAIRLLNPKNKTAIGKKAAPFELMSLDSGSNAQISSTALSGKYYLIDFWASWCGPCLGERASLQHAYERFGKSNFTIVSISLDKTPEDARQYQRKRWSMPWLNAFLPGGQDSQTARDYDVDWIGLPVLLLISPDGTILESKDTLGRLSLQTILARYLAGCGKTRFEGNAVPQNSLVSTTQPDKKKVCVEKTSNSWMCSAM